MQILHLDSSIQGDGSVSRQLTSALVRSLSENAPGATVVYRDLAAEPIPHLNGAIASAFRHTGTQETGDEARFEQVRSEVLVTELLASQVIVIGAPMYNFSIATQLKAWIDRIIQPGRTFQFSPSGAIGKAEGTRVVVASSRGGVYGQGLAEALDHQERYLSAVLGFIGIREVRFVRAEGTKGSEADQSIENALLDVPRVAKAILV